MGRLNDFPLASTAGGTLKFSLDLNRDKSAAVHQSRRRSYTSYGRIFSRPSATTLFGRFDVDKQNSVHFREVRFRRTLGTGPITKLPIQYAARTTTGTGISYMQMELRIATGS